MRSEQTHNLIGKLFEECKTTGVDCIVLIADKDCSETMVCRGTEINSPYIQSSISSLEEMIRNSSSQTSDRSAHKSKTE
ncbi:MAG: hypothetical protein ABID54_05310 [Pseudomonadota bacterium]